MYIGVVITWCTQHQITKTRFGIDLIPIPNVNVDRTIIEKQLHAILMPFNGLVYSFFAFIYVANDIEEFPI